jgi:hypothetical protein
MAGTSASRRPVFLLKLHSQHVVTSGKLGSYVSELSL